MKYSLKSLGNITVESVVFSLIAFFIFTLLLHLPLYRKNSKLNFLLNALWLGGLVYSLKIYIPLSEGLILLAFVLSIFLSLILALGKDEIQGKPIGENGVVPFVLKSNKGNIIFNNPFRNFLVIGGANAGKTASIGKPLLKSYIENGFAGFLYDMKDFDYTKTAYNLVNKLNYPH